MSHYYRGPYEISIDVRDPASFSILAPYRRDSREYVVVANVPIGPNGSSTDGKIQEVQAEIFAAAPDMLDILMDLVCMKEDGIEMAYRVNELAEKAKQILIRTKQRTS